MVVSSFLRLWAFFSILWASVVMAQSWNIVQPSRPIPDCVNAQTDEQCFNILVKEGKNPFDVLGSQSRAHVVYGRPVEPIPLLPYVYWAFVPPAVLLGLGMAVIVIVRGFLPGRS